MFKLFKTKDKQIEDLQKYADELQKRLELAKLIDTFEECENVELKVNIDWLESEVEEDGV